MLCNAQCVQSVVWVGWGRGRRYEPAGEVQGCVVWVGRVGVGKRSDGGICVLSLRLLLLGWDLPVQWQHR